MESFQYPLMEKCQLSLTKICDDGKFSISSPLPPKENTLFIMVRTKVGIRFREMRPNLTPIKVNLKSELVRIKL